MVYVFGFEHSTDFSKLFAEGQRAAGVILAERRRLVDEEDNDRRPAPDNLIFQHIDLNYMVLRSLTKRLFDSWSMDPVTIDRLSYRDNTGRYLRIDKDQFITMTPFNLKIDFTDTDFAVVYEAYPNLHLIGAELNQTHVRVSCMLDVKEDSRLLRKNWEWGTTTKKKARSRKNYTFNYNRNHIIVKPD